MGIIDLFQNVNDKNYMALVESLVDMDMTWEAREEQRIAYLKSQVLSYDLEIRRKAFEKVLLEKYTNYYRNEIDNGNADNIFPLLAKERELSDEKFTSKYLFVTINPRESYKDICDFKIVLEKAFTKPWINKFLYVIEQRGSSEKDDEIGKGFHMHCLIDKGDYRFSHARREFVSTFRKICDTQNYHTFNFSYCKEADLAKRQNYMIGQKADPLKHQKQVIDKIFRAQWGIKSYYGDLFVEKIGE